MYPLTSSVKQKFTDGKTEQILLLVSAAEIPAFLCSRFSDFDMDAARFTERLCDSDDVTFGNTMAKTAEFTVLNTDKRMKDYPFGDVMSAYIGVKTQETATQKVTGVNVSDTTGTVKGLTNGISAGGSVIHASGSWTSMFVTADGHYYLFDASGKCMDVVNDGGWSASSVSAAAVKDKLVNGLCVQIATDESKVTFYDYPGQKAEEFALCPMGRYDVTRPTAFSEYYITVEAVDRLSAADKDAKAWKESQTYPKTIGQLMNSALSYVGFSSVGAFRNSTAVISSNPFSDSAETMRDIISYIAEAALCNFRLSRTGASELYGIGAQSVLTLTESDIEEDSTAFSEYETEEIARVINNTCGGLTYNSGAQDGNAYYITANPLLPDNSLINLQTVRSAVPVYRPSTMTVLESLPSLETGDVILYVSELKSYAIGSRMMAKGSDAFGSAEILQFPITEIEYSFDVRVSANINASGNQTREIPESLRQTNYDTVVNADEGNLVNRIMASDLFAQNIEATNFNITGGSIQVDTTGYEDPSFLNVSIDYPSLGGDPAEHRDVNITGDGIQIFKEPQGQTFFELDIEGDHIAILTSDNIFGILINKDGIEFKSNGQRTALYKPDGTIVH